MTELLAADHAEVDALFRDLWEEFDRGRARAVFEKLDYLWARLAVHIRAEHLHLFPKLLSAVSAGDGGREGGQPEEEEVRGAVERLREDHDFFMHELAWAVNAARDLSARDEGNASGPLRRIRQRVEAVAGRLGEHNLVEERQVYLWPESLLGEDARAGLGREMKREIENLPPRFSREPAR
ncbi:MAG TPA: hemerythrin domain-containing protein [Pyrinomonadaceae bacterium]|jgi:hemerythrin superfamily protein|nr:hemerythrin domain-containing protein [Pyrinomonadaceae bacterium]